MTAGSPSANAAFTQACLLGKVGKEKVGIPRPDNAAFHSPLALPHRGETEAQRGHHQDSDLDFRLPVLPSLRSIWVHVPQDPEMWGREVCGCWQANVPEA